MLIVDSEKTVYDRDTEQWEDNLAPFAEDAESLRDFFNGSVQPLLRAVSQPGCEIFVGLDDRGSDYQGEPVLIIGTKPRYWGISLGYAGTGFDPSNGAGSRKKSYNFTGTTGQIFTAWADAETGTVGGDSLYWDDVPPPIRENVTLLTLPLGPGHTFLSMPWEPTGEGEAMALAESSFWFVNLESSGPLPKNHTSTSSQAFYESAVNLLVENAMSLTVSFLEEKIFTYDEYLGITRVSNPYKGG